MRLRAGTVLSAIISLGFLAASASSQSSISSNADSLFLQALRHQRAGDFAAAGTFYRALLRIAPDYHDARIQYSRVLAWDERYVDALAHLDSVLFLQPENSEARFTKALVFQWTRRYRQSADILLSLLEESPNSVRFLVETGTVYFLGGAPARALGYFEKAYLLAPSDRNIIRSLARTHRKLGNDDLALYWYRKLLAASPGDDEARAEILRLEYKSDHEIHVGTTYESFSGGSIPDHTSVQAEYYLTLGEEWKPFVHVSRVSKFSSKENRFGGGAYAAFEGGLGAFVQLLAAPSSTVAPDFDATLEGTGRVAAGLEAIAGYRYLRFDSLNVNIGIPGVTWYLGDDLWVTLRGYFGWIPDQPMSSSGLLTASFRATPSSTVRLGGFTGHELFRATSVSEISAFKSSGGFIGFKSRLHRSIAGEVVYVYTSRNLLSASHSVTAMVSLLF